ncbi:hypothetical protein ACOME3_008579 [Neoechinorhynchus agilis]
MSKKRDDKRHSHHRDGKRRKRSRSPNYSEVDRQRKRHKHRRSCRKGREPTIEHQMSLSPAPPKRTDDVPFFGNASLVDSITTVASDAPLPSDMSPIEIPPADPAILSLIPERTSIPPPLMSLDIPPPPERKRKCRKSRWLGGENDKTCIPGMPTSIPNNLTSEQERIYILQLQIEEITYRLRLLDQGVDASAVQAGASTNSQLTSTSSPAAAAAATTPSSSNTISKSTVRSPSPDPVYDLQGRRTNTRESRLKKRLEEERHVHVQRLLKLKPEYKPPIDYKPVVPKYVEKIPIPQTDYPEINFLGILIGPRGNSLKKLEQDSGAKIVIRGRGSSKDIRITPEEGDCDVLHAQITGSSLEVVQLASAKIREVIRKGIEEPETLEERRKTQLRELAILNGTFRENETLDRLKLLAEAESIVTNTIVCAICGAVGHVAADCLKKGDELEPFNPKSDPEYKALMEELGTDVCPDLIGREYALLKGIDCLRTECLSGRIKSGKVEPLLALPASESDRDGRINCVVTKKNAMEQSQQDMASLVLTSMKLSNSNLPEHIERFDFNIGLDAQRVEAREPFLPVSKTTTTVINGPEQVNFEQFMVNTNHEVDEDDPFGCRAAGIDPIAVGLVADPVSIKQSNAVSLQPHLAAALAAFSPNNTSVDPMATGNHSKMPLPNSFQYMMTGHAGNFNPCAVTPGPPPPIFQPHQQPSEPTLPSHNPPPYSYMANFLQHYMNAAATFSYQTPRLATNQQATRCSDPQPQPPPPQLRRSASPTTTQAANGSYAAAFAAAAMTNALPTSHQMLSTWFKSKEENNPNPYANCSRAEDERYVQH